MKEPSIPIGSIPVHWGPRAVPLAPAAVAARGESARSLADRLLAADDEQISRFEGVAGEDLLVVLGPAGELPWVEGAVYLGRDPSAPALLLPTTREPSLPLPLVERALIARARRVPGVLPPLAVLIHPTRLASTAEARPITRMKLLVWRGARLGDWIGMEG
jgi:hypothetical protein